MSAFATVEAAFGSDNFEPDIELVSGSAILKSGCHNLDSDCSATETVGDDRGMAGNDCPMPEVAGDDRHIAAAVDCS